MNALPAPAATGVQAATGVGPVVASLHRVSTNTLGADAETGVQLATGTSAVTLVWQARASHEVPASGVDGLHEPTAAAGDTILVQVLLVKPLPDVGSSSLVQVEPCTAVGPVGVTEQPVAVKLLLLLGPATVQPDVEPDGNIGVGPVDTVLHATLTKLLLDVAA